MLAALFGPCGISSDNLFFWDWWDREGIGGQYASEAEKLYFHFSWLCVCVLGNLYSGPSPALPSSLHGCM